MNISSIDLCVLGAALVAILMLGASHVRTNINLFGAQAVLLSIGTTCCAIVRNETYLYTVALILLLLKALVVPAYLLNASRRMSANNDAGTSICVPVSMVLGIAFAGGSFLAAQTLQTSASGMIGLLSTAASVSLVCSGLLLMLTRRLALSQIIGFLVMENGIYVFGMTQTQGMPLLVEMGVMLDVLVGVMLGGLVAFRIKKSFEHMDVTALAELRD